MPNSSIRPIDWTLSDSTIPAQSGIPKSSWTEVLPSECLMSYPEHSIGRWLTLSRDAVGVFHSPSQLSPKISAQKFFDGK